MSNINIEHCIQSALALIHMNKKLYLSFHNTSNERVHLNISNKNEHYIMYIMDKETSDDDTEYGVSKFFPIQVDICKIIQSYIEIDHIMMSESGGDEICIYRHPQ